MIVALNCSLQRSRLYFKLHFNLLNYYNKCFVIYYTVDSRYDNMCIYSIVWERSGEPQNRSDPIMSGEVRPFESVRARFCQGDPTDPTFRNVLALQLILYLATCKNTYTRYSILSSSIRFSIFAFRFSHSVNSCCFDNFQQIRGGWRRFANNLITLYVI